MRLISIPHLDGMEIKDLQRKIQYRNGSLVVTLPRLIVHELGLRRDQHVRFAVSKGKIIIKPFDSGISKKEITDANRDSSHLDGLESDVSGEGYKRDFERALERKDDDGSVAPNPSRLEKLKMR